MVHSYQTQANLEKNNKTIMMQLENLRTQYNKIRDIVELDADGNYNQAPEFLAFLDHLETKADLEVTLLENTDL